MKRSHYALVLITLALSNGAKLSIIVPTYTIDTQAGFMEDQLRRYQRRGHIV